MFARFVRALGAGLLGTAVAGAGAATAAETYPAKPIRVIVPYAAGGADTYIRPLQPALLTKHNTTFVIEIMVGAGGLIGANAVKRAAPDGYTILFCGSGALTIASRLGGGQPVAISDFAPVLNLVSIPYIITVRSDSPILQQGGFIDYVKRNPDKVSYGTPGNGSAPHLGMEAVQLAIGAKLTHAPFSGVATAVQSLLGGHIDSVIGAPSAIIPQVNIGRLVAVGVTSKSRFSLAPNVPTLAELGAPVDVSSHFGFYAPAGTPAPIVQTLAASIRDAAQDPQFLATMKTMYNEVTLLSAPELSRALAAEYAAFTPVIETLAKK